MGSRECAGEFATGLPDPDHARTRGTSHRAGTRRRLNVTYLLLSVYFNGWFRFRESGIFTEIAKVRKYISQNPHLFAVTRRRRKPAMKLSGDKTLRVNRKFSNFLQT